MRTHRPRNCFLLLALALALATFVLTAPVQGDDSNPWDEYLTCNEDCGDAKGRRNQRIGARMSAQEASEAQRKTDYRDCQNEYDQRGAAHNRQYNVWHGDCAAKPAAQQATCDTKNRQIWLGLQFNNSTQWMMCQGDADHAHDVRLGEIDSDYSDVSGMTFEDSEDLYGACRQDCQQYKPAPKPDGGSGDAGMTLEPCPPGTQPNPLGLCQTALLDGEPELEPGDDGCGPGEERGPDDGCRPKMGRLGFVVPAADDGWWVICPEGTRPGPVDGCVFDPGVVGGGWTEVFYPNGRDCPDGFTPGPAGDCVPVIPVNRSLAVGEGYEGSHFVADLAALAAEDLPADAKASMRILHTHDPVGALAATAEALAGPPVP